MTLGVIQQGDMITLNVYILNTTSKYIKQQMTELKIALGKFTIMVGDFDKALFVTDRISEQRKKKSVQKIQKIKLNFTQMTYTTCPPETAEGAFTSYAHGTCT